jgi:hypothetical protein
VYMMTARDAASEKVVGPQSAVACGERRSWENDRRCKPHFGPKSKRLLSELAELRAHSGAL